MLWKNDWIHCFEQWKLECTDTEGRKFHLNMMRQGYIFITNRPRESNYPLKTFTISKHLLANSQNKNISLKAHGLIIFQLGKSWDVPLSISRSAINPFTSTSLLANHEVRSCMQRHGRCTCRKTNTNPLKLCFRCRVCLFSDRRDPKWIRMMFAHVALVDINAICSYFWIAMHRARWKIAYDSRIFATIKTSLSERREFRKKWSAFNERICRQMPTCLFIRNSWMFRNRYCVHRQKLLFQYRKCFYIILFKTGTIFLAFFK